MKFISTNYELTSSRDADAWLCKAPTLSVPSETGLKDSRSRNTRESGRVDATVAWPRSLTIADHLPADTFERGYVRGVVWKREAQRSREKDEAASAVVTARDIHAHVLHTSLPGAVMDFPRGIRLPRWSHYQRSSSTPSGRTNLLGSATIKIIIGPDRCPSSCPASVHTAVARTRVTIKIIRYSVRRVSYLPHSANCETRQGRETSTGVAARFAIGISRCDCEFDCRTSVATSFSLVEKDDREAEGWS